LLTHCALAAYLLLAIHPDSGHDTLAAIGNLLYILLRQRKSSEAIRPGEKEIASILDHVTSMTEVVIDALQTIATAMESAGGILKRVYSSRIIDLIFPEIESSYQNEVLSA
jgi:hypothetical protein